MFLVININFNHLYRKSNDRGK